MHFLLHFVTRKYGFPLQSFHSQNHVISNIYSHKYICRTGTRPGRGPEGKRSSPTARMHNHVQAHYRQNIQKKWLKKLEHSRYKEPGPVDLFSCREKSLTKNTEQKKISLKTQESNRASDNPNFSGNFLGFRTLQPPICLAELQASTSSQPIPPHSTYCQTAKGSCNEHTKQFKNIEPKNHL